MPPKDIGTFTESVARNIKILKDLHSSNPIAKYAFHPEGKKICDDYVEPNKIVVNCKIMSSAIMKIIGRSSNDEFRKQCLTLLDVSDTRETGEAIMRKLTALGPADSRQEGKKEKNVSTALRNDQTRQRVKVNQDNTVNEEYNRVNQETMRVNQENTRVTEQSSNTKGDQGRTKENNRAEKVDLPIIVSSRGRRLKKTKFYDEIYRG